MKTVYFVRHGETEGNAKKFYQLPTTPLSDVGREQAKIVAERATKLPVELVVSSQMDRAVETADIIAKRIGKPRAIERSFGEFLRPTEIRGKPSGDPSAKIYHDLMREHFHDSNWRYADEENFEDLKGRAIASFTYLEERPEEHIMVVTHGYFLRILLAYLFFGKELTSEQCEHFLQVARSKNTGLTVFQFGTKSEIEAGVAQPKEERWRLWIWNDHAHLG